MVCVGGGGGWNRDLGGAGRETKPQSTQAEQNWVDNIDLKTNNR